VQLSPTTGGYHVEGFLTPEVGQALKTALEAVTPVPAAGTPAPLTSAAPRAWVPRPTS
jgi:hypothetical protein